MGGRQFRKDPFPFRDRSQVRAFRNLLWLASWFQPVLTLLMPKLGVLSQMVKQLDGLIALDRFNDVFGKRGWLLHRWLHQGAALEAIAAADACDWGRAEQLLVNSYSAASVSVGLMQMTQLPCFEKRGRLARLALADYEAGRYHACIPVVLALLDGMGQELTGAGFLRQGVRFAKTSSFLEIGPGIAALVKLMSAARGKVTTEQITVPYRHGILHGSDLGYDNPAVAAKSWGALFAVASYAFDLEESLLPEEPKPSLGDALERHKAIKERSERVARFCERWTARSPDAVLREVRRGAAPLGSPEWIVVDFMTAWLSRNFGRMAERVRRTEDETLNALAGRIRSNLGDPPQSFTVTNIEETAPAACWVTISVDWSVAEEATIQIRLIHSDDGTGDPGSWTSGAWQIFNLWPFEAERLRVDAVLATRER